MRKTKIKLIRIGMSTSDIASGAADTHHALQNYIQHRGLDIPILQTGSLGACHREPLVEIVTDEQSYLYGPITAERVRPILNQHLGSGERGISPEWVVSQYSDRRDYPFLQKQVRVTTQLCGLINPFSLDDYLAHDGYKAWEHALTLAPSEVVEMVKASKLRGRGGAGYPTGNKWGYIASKNITPKYFICNADEGDPGAFMDRAMIEGDPHRLLEGMLIAGYATGATRGYIYIRAEYPLAVRALRHAIRQIEERGLLGPNAFGQGKPYDIIIKEGAGAFVCGEETALMHSIEGLRGVPSMRPPYPAERGLWGYPSNINNVETLCSIPTILLKGPEWFASIGTAKSGGTKAFALAGSIRKSGLVEVPLGTSLHELIFDMAGGCADGHTLKGIQLGGPSGGCIPAHLLDLPIDYEELSATGAIMGSGGMIAIDDTTSMVAFARYFLNFTQEESCGKCVPCRVGTRKMLNILDKILAHKATSADLDSLRGLCHTVGKASLCGLGQTAPNPVLTTLRYFEEEYLALLN